MGISLLNIRGLVDKTVASRSQQSFSPNMFFKTISHKYINYI